MISWPSTFVIAVAICAGSFFYNKPTDAALGVSDRYSIPIDINRGWVQLEAKKQRFCAAHNTAIKNKQPSGIICLPWKTD
jgi:hypothetical protein